MDLFTLINFYIVPGVLVGFIYASGAIGITLLFSVLRFANLAHGDMITLGAYLCLIGIGIGTPIWLAVAHGDANSGNVVFIVRSSVLCTPSLKAKNYDGDGVSRYRLYAAC